jgi:hypothetical protein
MSDVFGEGCPADGETPDHKVSLPSFYPDATTVVLRLVLPGLVPDVPGHGPRGPISGDRRVLRGGSFLRHQSYCFRPSVSARFSNTLYSAASNTAFAAPMTAEASAGHQVLRPRPRLVDGRRLQEQPAALRNRSRKRHREDAHQQACVADESDAAALVASNDKRL